MPNTHGLYSDLELSLAHHQIKKQEKLVWHHSEAAELTLSAADRQHHLFVAARRLSPPPRTQHSQSNAATLLCSADVGGLITEF